MIILQVKNLVAGYFSWWTMILLNIQCFVFGFTDEQLYGNQK